MSVASPLVASVLPGPKEFTANLGQAAATYDLATASGDLIITSVTLYITVAGAGLTSVALQSNSTVPFIVLAAADGLLAALLAGKTLPTTWTQTQGFGLRSGQKLQYTIVGAGAAGTMKADVTFLPVTAGASLV